MGNQLRCRDFCCFPEISRMSRVEGPGSFSACFFGIISAHQQWRRRLQGKGQNLCSRIYQAKFGYSIVNFIKWGPRPKEAPTELILLQISWTPNICRLLAWEKMQSGDLLRDSSLGLLYKLWSQTDLSSDSGPTIWKLYKLGQDIELLRDSIPLFSNWG